jgi:hypothetical protein
MDGNRNVELEPRMTAEFAFPCGAVVGPRTADAIGDLPESHHFKVIMAILVDCGLAREVHDPAPTPTWPLKKTVNGRGKRKPETLAAIARRDVAIVRLASDGSSAEAIRKRIARAVILRRPAATEIEKAATDAFTATGKIPSVRAIQRAVRKKRATK